MQRELDSAVKNQIKQQVMDGLADIHEFPIPGDIVQREIQVLKEQMMRQFQMPPGQAQSLDLPDALVPRSSRKAREGGLIVNEVISSQASWWLTLRKSMRSSKSWQHPTASRTK